MKFTMVLGLVLLQFGTPIWNGALADESKTDQKVDPLPEIPPKGMLPHALLSMATQSPFFSKYALLVDKKRRTLTVWESDGDKVKLVEALPTDIGRLDGDKMSEGDFKTPEGIYFFENTMDGHKVDFKLYGDRIYTMDYPNYFDRLDKKTGKGIWLHAIPDTTSLLRGSRGCVVVRNKVIEHLGKYIELKRTPIVIVNSVDYLSEGDWTKLQAEMKGFLEKWRQAWVGKDLEKYMNLYSDVFSGNGMNKKQWRRYKRGLANQYDFISVNIDDVQIFNHGRKIVLRFLQSYKSNMKQDYGSKILYAWKVNDHYEIIGETWLPVRPAPAQFQAQTRDPVVGNTSRADSSAVEIIPPPKTPESSPTQNN